jgi:hypothetical protein
MSNKSPFLVLNKDCREAVRWLSNHLEHSGMQVVQTFDLDDTRINHRRLSSSQHGTEGCGCEQLRGTLAILFVYANGLPPASIVAQSREGQTWFTLVDSPQQSLHSGLAEAIQDALAAHIFDLLEDPANIS